MLTSLKIAPLPVSLSKDIANLANKRNTKNGVSAIEVDYLRESGLLSLIVPKQYGGMGATWKEALKVVQKIASYDGSIGQLYGNHLNLSVLAHVLGTSEQKQRYYQQTAENNGFWANAIDNWDTRLKITQDGDNFRLNGVKKFDPIVANADWRVFSAMPAQGEPIFLIIPQDRAGIIANNNSEFAQSQSNLTTFIFHNVFVKRSEIVAPPKPAAHPFSSFLGIIAQLSKTYVYLGIAQGALEAAQSTGKTTEVDSTKQDPYILGDYGNLWLELKTAIGLADEVADIVQALWEKELTLTEEERSEVAIAIFAAEAFATRVGWEISNKLFKQGDAYSENDRLRDLQSFGGVSMPWKGAPQNWTLNYLPQ